MNYLKRVFFYLVLLSIYSLEAKEVFTPYYAGDWKKISQKNSNQPVVIHFWGVSCVPCMKELPQWGKFLAKEQRIKPIFIQVDHASQELITKRLKIAKIDQFEHYFLASNFDEFIYFEVDKEWHGEIPMTIMIGKDGKKQKILGSMDFKDLKQWLSHQ